MKTKSLLLALVCGLLALAMLTLPSCGKQKEDPAATTAVTSTEEKPANMNSAETLVWEFRSLVKANPDKSVEELANLYAALEPVKAQHVKVYGEAYPTDYEPFFYGFLPEFKLPHYVAAYAVKPSIFPNNYTSVVFELDEDCDAAAFCQTLTKNADLAFSVCMPSDEVACGCEGRYALFVICGHNTVEGADIH